MPIYNLFINLCQFQWQVKYTDTFDHLFFDESLKIVFGTTVSNVFNVFIQPLRTSFLLLSRFYVFNVFLKFYSLLFLHRQA